jgi:hypothetical protein
VRRKLYHLALDASEAYTAGEITPQQVVARLKALLEEVRQEPAQDISGAGGVRSDEHMGEPEVININVEVNTLNMYLRSIERGEITADDALRDLLRVGTEAS